MEQYLPGLFDSRHYREFADQWLTFCPGTPRDNAVLRYAYVLHCHSFRMAARLPPAIPKLRAMNFPAEWSLEAAIGAKIRLTSSIPAINGLEGLIASASPSNDLLILKAPSSAANSDSGNKTPLKMVSIAAIHSVSLLAPPSPAQTQTRNLPTTDTLNVEALQTRLGANITNLKGEDARRGKGVTPEAQHLFDAMSRTMATRWEGTDIVVTDAVIIPSPYRPEDCKLIPGIQGSASLALPRIRQVLGKERFRLLNKEQAKLGMLPIVPAVPSQVEKKGG